jgi:filamentous hemagglutinin family protein
MMQRWQHWNRRSELARALMVSGAIAGLMGGIIPSDSALAQRRPIADTSLGNENSVVIPDAEGLPVRGDRIDGGARRGNNLFHSFQEFNIEAGRSAYFTNPSGVENILTRVTGMGRSEILGTLGVLNGDANLFLINPNGIIFGENANLDVGGSFLTSTANAIQFEEQGWFSTSEPNSPSLLTVNPSALLFNQIAAQPLSSIEIKGTLAVLENRSLLFVGGNVAPTHTSTGGILLSGGSLAAPSGRIELAGVSAPGTVELDVVDRVPRLGSLDNIARSDISLTNRALIRADGTSGDIEVQGRTVSLREGSAITVYTVGTGTAGNLSVNASELVELIGAAGANFPGGLSTQTVGTGSAGTLSIQTRQLIVRGGAQVTTGAFGDGVGGSLSVNASDSIELNGFTANGPFPSGLFTENVEGTGASGNLSIQTRQLRILGGALISTSGIGGGLAGNLSINASESIEVSGIFRSGRFVAPSSLATIAFGEGDAGAMTLQTRRLIIRDGGNVSASTSGSGNGGRLLVRASELVQLRGGSSPLLSILSSNTRGSGTAGELSITTRRLQLQGGAQITAGTFGVGDGGSLIVTASDSVQAIGSSDRFPSGLIVNTQGTGDAGDLSITTGQLIVRDGAQITASTRAAGDGGRVTIRASDLVQVSGFGTGFPSGLLTSTQGSGDAGNMTIQTRRLIIRDGARVTADTFGTSSQGDAGRLTVRASESVQVIGTSSDRQNPSRLSTQTQGTGAAGDLTINTRRLHARNGAVISVRSLGSSRAGDLEVTARNLVLNNLAELTAETESGSGGTIQLNLLNSLSLQGESQVSASTQNGQGGRLIVSSDRAPVNVIDVRDRSRISTEATGSGSAGNLTFNTNQLVVEDGAEVTVSSPNGRAGNLTVIADQVRLNQGELTAQTGVSRGQAGANIRLRNLDLLQLQNGSQLSADAGTIANGGNITIGAEFIIATPGENNDIQANAVEGRGGNIDITATSLFGIAYRDRSTPDNDITASSEFGLDGIVNLNTPEIDPSRGLEELPVEVADASQQIAQTCPTSENIAGEISEFIITGRGGLPPTPNEVSESDIWEDLRSFNEEDDRSSTSPSLTSTPQTVIEAQGWMTSPNGGVILVAQAPTVTPYSSWQTPIGCQTR